MGELARTALSIEGDLLEKFDRWMASHGYANRSQAVRDLIRAALVEQEWSNPKARVVASLSIIYDHAAHDLAQAMTDIQHRDYRAVLCSQHVHLDRHHCLEVILMQGRAAELRNLADSIIATRGVRAGKLTLLSVSV